jgi:hypothetical protein
MDQWLNDVELNVVSEDMAAKHPLPQKSFDKQLLAAIIAHKSNPTGVDEVRRLRAIYHKQAISYFKYVEESVNKDNYISTFPLHYEKLPLPLQLIGISYLTIMASLIDSMLTSISNVVTVVTEEYKKNSIYISFLPRDMDVDSYKAVRAFWDNVVEKIYVLQSNPNSLIKSQYRVLIAEYKLDESLTKDVRTKSEAVDYIKTKLIATFDIKENNYFTSYCARNKTTKLLLEKIGFLDMDETDFVQITYYDDIFDSSQAHQYLRLNWSKYVSMFQNMLAANSMTMTSPDIGYNADMPVSTHRPSPIQNDAILKLFNLISEIACLKTQPLVNRGIETAIVIHRPILKYLSEKFVRSVSKVTYAFPNNVGHFDVELYLEALIEYGIILVGCVVIFQEFDGFTGCPSKFMLHDMYHLTELEDYMSNTRAGVVLNKATVARLYNLVKNTPITQYFTEAIRHAALCYIFHIIHEERALFQAEPKLLTNYTPADLTTNVKRTVKEFKLDLNPILLDFERYIESNYTSEAEFIEKNLVTKNLVMGLGFHFTLLDFDPRPIVRFSYFLWMLINHGTLAFLERMVAINVVSRKAKSYQYV